MGRVRSGAYRRESDHHTEQGPCDHRRGGLQRANPCGALVRSTFANEWVFVMNTVDTEVGSITHPRAIRRTRGFVWPMPVWCIQISVARDAGKLPVQRRRSTSQSTLPLW